MKPAPGDPIPGGRGASRRPVLPGVDGLAVGARGWCPGPGSDGADDRRRPTAGSGSASSERHHRFGGTSSHTHSARALPPASLWGGDGVRFILVDLSRPRAMFRASRQATFTTSPATSHTNPLRHTPRALHATADEVVRPCPPYGEKGGRRGSEPAAPGRDRHLRGDPGRARRGLASPPEAVVSVGAAAGHDGRRPTPSSRPRCLSGEELVC